MTVMPRFTKRQARDAQKVIGNLIRQTGVTARVYRPVVADANSFYGPREASEVLISETPVEPRPLTPENLAELGSDLVAGALPEADVRENDLLVIADVRYRVTRLDPSEVLGIRTHVELFLEHAHQNGQP